MDDLISRQSAIDALKNERSDWNCDYNVPVDHCIDAIYSLPSAQKESCDGCKWEYAFGYGECHHCKRSFNDMYEETDNE